MEVIFLAQVNFLYSLTHKADQGRQKSLYIPYITVSFTFSKNVEGIEYNRIMLCHTVK